MKSNRTGANKKIFIQPIIPLQIDLASVIIGNSYSFQNQIIIINSIWFIILFFSNTILLYLFVPIIS